LIDIVENNLHESYEKAILDHLALCPKCNRLVRSFTHAWEELSSAEKQIPSESFWPDLLEKVQASEKQVPIREKIIRGFRNSLRPVTVSLILLISVLIGYQLGNRPGMDTTLPEPYIEQYVQDFQDFPEGSVSDFFMKYEFSLEEEIF
jgi:hypothetical protein